MNPEKIDCPVCGEVSFLKRSPDYDGFRKIGEILSCVSCRHVFDDEKNVPFHSPAPSPSRGPDAAPSILDAWFGTDAINRSCRHCKHYVVNPFIQRCALHQREVEATDDCEQFSKREAPRS